MGAEHALNVDLWECHLLKFLFFILLITVLMFKDSSHFVPVLHISVSKMQKIRSKSGFKNSQEADLICFHYKNL